MMNSSGGTRSFPLLLSNTRTATSTPSTPFTASSSLNGLEGEVEEEEESVSPIASRLHERSKKDRTLPVFDPSTYSTISLRLLATKNHKVTGQPRRWRLEILRAHGLPRVSTKNTNNVSGKRTPVVQHKARSEKSKPLSLVVCEVLWKGPGDLGLSATLIDDLGSTVSFLKDVDRGSKDGEGVEKVDKKEDKGVGKVLVAGKEPIDPETRPLEMKPFSHGKEEIDKEKTEEKTKEKKKKTMTKLLSNWVSVGCTGRIYFTESNADPRFADKEGGAGAFDFPPIWTCSGRKGERSLAKTERELNGPGDWMPRNYISRPPLEAISFKGDKCPLRLDAVVRAVICFLSIHKLALSKPGSAEMRKKRDVWRLLSDAEEGERVAMAREELIMRTLFIDEEEDKYRVPVELQLTIARQFSQLMTLIQCPTRTLSRLRFFMGCYLESGGVRVTCQDPAANEGCKRKLLEVFVVPLLYPEDEEEMRRHVDALDTASRNTSAITPVIELSIHLVKGYTAMGFTAGDTRTALTLMERNDDRFTLCEHLRGKGVISDKDFIALLIQVLEGLSALHCEGIIHRNLHAECVYIQDIVPSSTRSRQATPTGKKDKGTLSSNDKKKTVCRLGDFWFLCNPRGPGCVYSQGRADWGDKSTAPPEVRGGYKISCISDVYAFGLCVLQWVQCVYRKSDMDLDFNRDSNHIAEKAKVGAIANDIMLGYGTSDTMIMAPHEPLQSLGSLVPPRWGSNSWLYRLLRMSLQENPKQRVPAEELLQFLKDLDIEDVASG